MYLVVSSIQVSNPDTHNQTSNVVFRTRLGISEDKIVIDYSKPFADLKAQFQQWASAAGDTAIAPVLGYNISHANGNGVVTRYGVFTPGNAPRSFWANLWVGLAGTQV